jgi:hypothetical protein
VIENVLDGHESIVLYLARTELSKRAVHDSLVQMLGSDPVSECIVIKRLRAGSCTHSHEMRTKEGDEEQSEIDDAIL